MIRSLREDEVTFELECLDEDATLDRLDAEAQQWIRVQLEQGNPWAWFCAKVTAKWKGFESEPQYLGCCSYESEENFRADPYFADMKREALDSLNSSLRLADEGMEELRE